MPHNKVTMPHKEAGRSPSEGGMVDGSGWEALVMLSREARQKKRLDLEPLILTLCEGRYITKEQLARLLGRAERTLRNHYLTRLVREGKLEMLHPDKPRSPMQAYRTTRGTQGR